ncbi:hypothetical protein [Ensifer soli]|uniref:hypothetical protein n=1 Tax=Ciceribacter sp. sgz301302 TaxID=3342379 RepID=UPI0035B6D509
MKFEKTFSKPAANSRMVYATSPIVPFPLKVRSVTLYIDGEHGPKQFLAKHNETVIASGVVRSGEPVRLDPPIRLGAGRQTFVFAAEPFTKGETVEGRLVIETSMF